MEKINFSVTKPMDSCIPIFGVLQVEVTILTIKKGVAIETVTSIGELAHTPGLILNTFSLNGLLFFNSFAMKARHLDRWFYNTHWRRRMRSPSDQSDQAHIFTHTAVTDSGIIIFSAIILVKKLYQPLVSLQLNRR